MKFYQNAVGRCCKCEHHVNRVRHYGQLAIPSREHSVICSVV